jgi:uncharacterized membrane protein
MWALRAIMLLALIVWIGGIIFFAFVLAPTLFRVLPDTLLAGKVVSPALSKLHCMGLIAGAIFLLASVLYDRRKYLRLRLFTATHVLMVAMLALTAYSQFVITPRMHAIRIRMQSVNSPTWDDTPFIEFHAAHELSTWLEGTVLSLGLIVVVLTARRMGEASR